MKLELTALVLGAIVGAGLALAIASQNKGPGAVTDFGGNVSIGLEDRSLR